MAENNSSGMIRRETAQAPGRVADTSADIAAMASHMQNTGGLIRRSDFSSQPPGAAQPDQDAPEKQLPSDASPSHSDQPRQGSVSVAVASAVTSASNKADEATALTDKAAEAKRKAVQMIEAKKRQLQQAQQSAAGQPPQQVSSVQQHVQQAQQAAAQQSSQSQQPQPQSQPQQPIRVRHAYTLDSLNQSYMGLFKSYLDLELSASICFENMRRLCEPSALDPASSLYFLENTYRLSTLAYLAANLPIMIISSLIADKNRGNMLKYISSEVEAGHKPYEEVKALRLRRIGRKYDGIALCDMPSVTVGLTHLTPEMSAVLTSHLSGISSTMARFSNELTQIVSRFDGPARNDVVFIYSNWWFLLQGFENVPEMRSYITAITDSTRANLKL